MTEDSTYSHAQNKTRITKEEFDRYPQLTFEQLAKWEQLPSESWFEKMVRWNDNYNNKE